MKNLEEKLEMIKDLWITCQTLKFYRPEKGTHEAFHVADTTNWVEGKLNLLILNNEKENESTLKEQIKEFEERYKKDKEIIENLENELHQLQWYANEPEETEEEELFDDYDSIPEVTEPLKIEENIENTLEKLDFKIQKIGKQEILTPEIKLKIDTRPMGKQIEIANKFLKSCKPEKPERVIPEEKRKNIEEGIIKFFKSRGKKTSFRYGYNQTSTPEAVKEAEEIKELCKTGECILIRQVLKSLISSGRIIKHDRKGSNTRFEVYSLNEYPKPKSRCPKCGGFSLVKNENKYSSNEDYYHDKNGCYYTCLTCGEEVGYTEKEAA